MLYFLWALWHICCVSLHLVFSLLLYFFIFLLAYKNVFIVVLVVTFVYTPYLNALSLLLFLFNFLLTYLLIFDGVFNFHYCLCNLSMSLFCCFFHSPFLTIFICIISISPDCIRFMCHVFIFVLIFTLDLGLCLNTKCSPSSPCLSFQLHLIWLIFCYLSS